jgi:hypothetical protein
MRSFLVVSIALSTMASFSSASPLPYPDQDWQTVCPQNGASYSVTIGDETDQGCLINNVYGDTPPSASDMWSFASSIINSFFHPQPQYA